MTGEKQRPDMPKPFEIPSSLAQTNIEVHGAAGADWVKRLPLVASECERRWSLTLGPPFPRLSYNYAAPATCVDGSAAVVKIGFPDKEFVSGAEALKLYGGRGAVQLLDFDLEQGVLLLERLEPGTLLLEVRDDSEATSIAAAVMKQLWRPAPADHHFPTVAGWGQGFVRLRKEFGGGTGPFPPGLVDEAERLFADLLASMAEPVLLHGDLHHFNILAARRDPWLAIDPKGVVGEPAYEVGALLRNPMPEIASQPNLAQILGRRLDQLADELCLDHERLRGWGMAQAVLSAWWSYEDHGDADDTSLRVAELLSARNA